MIQLLAKLFIKNHKDMQNPVVREKYGILCGGFGIFLNLVLFAFKYFAGVVSSSIAITADAFNNLSDAGSSLITLLGFKMASEKSDSDHPFGHGRMEYLSGLLVSIAIILMGYELIKTSIVKIMHPEVVTFSPLIVVILIASVSVKFYMFIYNRGIGKEITSASLIATSTDSFSDMIATTVVLLSMIVSYFTGFYIDGYCGLLVGLFIGFAGVSAAKGTIDPLLGTPPTEEFVASVEQIVMSHEDIVGIHDLIVHNYGPGRVMISLHAEVPDSGNLNELHDTIDNIERDLKEELKCHAVIHMDPVKIGDETTDKLRKQVNDIISAIDPVLTIHDFRVVTGPTHTNLIFDLVVPHRFRFTDNQIQDMVALEAKTLDPSYFTVIEVDHDFCG